MVDATGQGHTRHGQVHAGVMRRHGPSATRRGQCIDTVHGETLEILRISPNDASHFYQTTTQWIVSQSMHHLLARSNSHHLLARSNSPCHIHSLTGFSNTEGLFRVVDGIAARYRQSPLCKTHTHEKCHSMRGQAHVRPCCCIFTPCQASKMDRCPWRQWPNTECQ
jgi:hypothetical protein